MNPVKSTDRHRVFVVRHALERCVDTIYQALRDLPRAHEGDTLVAKLRLVLGVASKALDDIRPHSEEDTRTDPDHRGE